MPAIVNHVLATYRNIDNPKTTRHVFMDAHSDIPTSLAADARLFYLDHTTEVVVVKTTEPVRVPSHLRQQAVYDAVVWGGGQIYIFYPADAVVRDTIYSTSGWVFQRYGSIIHA